MNPLDQYKAAIRRLIENYEDRAIENMVYYQAIVEEGKINIPTLDAEVAAALLNPDMRKEARRIYGPMLAAVEDSGTESVFAGLLRDLPPNDKPN